MFFRKYQVGYLATRGPNQSKEKRDILPAPRSELLTIKPRFIYKKQKNDLSFYSWLISDYSWLISFSENTCEDYLSLFNWMDILNVVVLIEENIQNMEQDM